MAAYVVITREKTRNAAKLDEYKKIAPASFRKHPATFLAIHGRQEVLEGPKNEDIISLLESVITSLSQFAFEQSCSFSYRRTTLDSISLLKGS